MLKNSFTMFLAFFLALGTLTFHQSAEARTAKKPSHGKVKKKPSKKHYKSSPKTAKHSKKKDKKHHKVAKMKKSSQKKKMIAKNQRSVGRKIASVSKKHKQNKVKRHRRNLPKEYGSI